MTDQVKCPKCSSTQISAQQKGFSTGKAAAGAILTGGVGLLAGFVGSSNIEVVCLNCGTKWNPKRLADERARLKADSASRERKEWTREFYHAYLSNDVDKALAIAEYRRGAQLKIKGLTGVYKDLKSEDATTLILQLIIWGLFAAFAIWMISCLT